MDDVHNPSTVTFLLVDYVEMCRDLGNLDRRAFIYGYRAYETWRRVGGMKSEPCDEQHSAVREAG